MSRILGLTLCAALLLGGASGCRSAVKKTVTTAGHVAATGVKTGARATVEGAKITGGVVVDVLNGPDDDKDHGKKDRKNRKDK